MPAGRPTDYTPELCEKVILLLKEGMDIAELGLELDVGYSTIYKWMDKHPKFREAINKGREFSEGCWTRAGRLNLTNKNFNSRNYELQMQNRFDWNKKSQQSHVVEIKESTAKLEDIKKQYGRDY